MNRTKIETIKNPNGSQGYTWNPITGCLYHIDGMCKGGNFPCWAYGLANGRLKSRYIDNPNIALPKSMEKLDLHSEDVGEQLHDPFYPRFWEDKLEEILHRRIDSSLKGIFCCDMSDLFGIGIPEEWTRKVLGAIETNFYDRFYLLTKQPQNLIKFSPFPDNCWVGVTVTNNKQVTPAFESLSNIEAKVKYLSFEPLLEGLGERNRVLISQEFMTWFDWVIIGSQTKPTVYPKIESVREIVEACDKAGIPVFLKNKLLPIMGGYPIPKANMWAYKFEGGCFNLRQEMPSGI